MQLARRACQSLANRSRIARKVVGSQLQAARKPLASRLQLPPKLIVGESKIHPGRHRNRPSEFQKSSQDRPGVSWGPATLRNARPRSAQERPKSGPRALQERTKSAQERPKSGPRPPRRSPEPPQETSPSAPGSPQGPFGGLEAQKKLRSKAIPRASGSRSEFGAIFG